MPWFKVDENLLTHPKFMGLSDGAVALWLRAGVWSASALTNGEVPHHALRILAERGDDSAGELMERGLWERSRNGYRFHDWNDYQPSPEHVEEVRAKRREAGRKGGLTSANKQSAKQSAKQNRSKTEATGQAKPKQTPKPVPDTVTTELSLRSSSCCAEQTAEQIARPDTAQTIVAEWIDRCRKRPPDSVIGQASRHIREMLAEGIEADDIRRGVAVWMTKGLHPSALPAVVNEVMNSSPRSRQQSETDDLFERAQQRLAARKAATG